MARWLLTLDRATKDRLMFGIVLGGGVFAKLIGIISPGLHRSSGGLIVQTIVAMDFGILAALLFFFRRRRGPATVRHLARARRTFGILSALVPRRIADEELGDAEEDIERRITEGRPAIEVNLKIGATVFWTLVHALGYLVGCLVKDSGIADIVKAFRR